MKRYGLAGPAKADLDEIGCISLNKVVLKRRTG